MTTDSVTKSVSRLLSIAYVAGIFLFADSSVISDLSPFNPYSLLHIPLYGILTLLLFFSFVPLKSHSTRFPIVGLVATMVGVADEIHQAYVPGRNASVVDVFLDMVGIVLCLFAIKHFS